MVDSLDQRTMLFEKIIGYLKSYPFLLICMAALLVLAGNYVVQKVADSARLGNVETWVVGGIGLVALCMQFGLEMQKMALERMRTQAELNAAHPPAVLHAEAEGEVDEIAPPAPATRARQPSPLPRRAADGVEIAAVHISLKAILALVVTIPVFLLFSLPEEDLADAGLQGGMLILEGLAFVLALMGFRDTSRGKASGRGLAIGVMIFAGVLALASFGWLIDEGNAAQYENYDEGYGQFVAPGERGLTWLLAG